MCAEHGVRHAYAQAHHHPANGKAEQIGSKLQKLLRAVWAERGFSWVEALQRVVQQHNDQEGAAGLSPYEILYGRHRSYAGVPYDPPSRAEDAVHFFERQRKVDVEVAEKMNALQEKRAEIVNRHRKELPPFKVGDVVWYLRPRGRPGEKLESYWLGPSQVTERRGEHSYVIQLQEGRLQEAHRSQLKPCLEGEVELGPPIKLFHFKQARQDPPTAIDEWNVEKVLGHRRRNGELEFNVRWEASPECTWEPLHNFFHLYSQPIVDYFREKGLKEDVMAHLARHPPEVATAVLAVASRDSCVPGLVWEDPPEEWHWEHHNAEKKMQHGKVSNGASSGVEGESKKKGSGKAQQAAHRWIQVGAHPAEPWAFQPPLSSFVRPRSSQVRGGARGWSSWSW